MRAVVSRVLGVGVTLPLLLGGWLLTPGSPARPTCAFAAGTHHMAVVVEHGNGSVLSRCVAFTADRLRGDEAMRMSGIEYGTSSYGSALGSASARSMGSPPPTRLPA